MILEIFFREPLIFTYTKLEVADRFLLTANLDPLTVVMCLEESSGHVLTPQLVMSVTGTEWRRDSTLLSLY